MSPPFAFASAFFKGCLSSGLPAGYLVAMRHAPFGDEASAKALDHCIHEEIEAYLANNAKTKAVEEIARDLIREAVFDIAASSHQAMRDDFEAACKTCVTCAVERVRRHRRRMTPYIGGSDDPQDHRSAENNFRQAFWHRYLDCNALVRRVVEMRIASFEIDDIAARVGCGRATVVRILADVHDFGL